VATECAEVEMNPVEGSATPVPRSRGWKIATIVAVALLLLSNAFWLYQLLDAAVGRMYADHLRYEESHRCKALTKVSTSHVRGMSIEAATKLMKEIDPTSEPFVKDGALNSTWISFAIGPDGKMSGLVSDCPDVATAAE
jgi:hypothetical protein